MEAKAVAHNLANPYEGDVRASSSSLRLVEENTVSCRVCAPCVGWRNLKLRESHGTRWFWHTNGTHEFLCATSGLYASAVRDWHEKNNHKDTEYSEVAQRRVQLGTTIQRQ